MWNNKALLLGVALKNKYGEKKEIRIRMIKEDGVKVSDT